MHMYFAMFTSIIALPFYIFSDTIFDHMIITFLFPYDIYRGSILGSYFT